MKSKLLLIRIGLLFLSVLYVIDNSFILYRSSFMFSLQLLDLLWLLRAFIKNNNFGII